jgi:N-acetylmuramate 1-kinase
MGTSVQLDPFKTTMNLATAIDWPSDARRAAFEAWLASITKAHALLPQSLRAASADASFRRYLRIDTTNGATNGTSLIVMDAPPPLEKTGPFVAVAELIQNAGLNGPRVLAHDEANGFVLLTDLGSRLCLQVLNEARAAQDSSTIAQLMGQATAALVQWQIKIDASALPASYDDAMLRRELGLFPTWCVEREFAHTWTSAQQAIWQTVCDHLVASALAQPTVAVHRDYMPRNLMVLPANAVGILDFQDAVRGPISYDVASLWRDAFISWDEPQEIDGAVRYWEAARAAGLPVPADFGDFWRQLEWMGLQRHLKVLGIFCRLKHRDAKPNYSRDLPRFFNYAHRVASRYAELRPLVTLIEPLMGTERVQAFY